jgi:hypothetical protein
VKYLLILAVAVLVGCSDARPANPMLTYEQLKSFQVDCEKKEEQLKQLNYIKARKNFPENPEDITDEMDRAYNSRLKATIWWYTYRCEQ